jgi:uncharacterized membrane protein YeaQ/YmgE (transglycosylase-associated protein family)
MDNMLLWIGMGVLAGLAADLFGPARWFGGVFGNLMLGIAGSLAGAFLFNIFLNGGHGAWIGSTLFASVGAVGLLALVFFVTRTHHTAGHCPT